MPSVERLDSLRLAILTPTLGLGGLERIAVELAIGLKERIGDLCVYTAGGPWFGRPYEKLLEAAGVPVTLIPQLRPRAASLLAVGTALARELRRRPADVIHAHNPTAGAAAAVARLLLADRRMAVVTTYHGVMPHRLRRASRALVLASDLVVGVSPSATRALMAAGLPLARAATVMNAVRASPQRPAEAVRRSLGIGGLPLIVSVGRYVEEKNYPVLLSALSRLVAEGRELRALLVGHGPLEHELRSRAAALGLDGTVVLTGPRLDAVDITAAADVFSLSSRSEGLPLALLEAMAVGRPVVATDVGGMGDVVRNDVTGFLVPPDDPVALASALARMLDEPRRAASLGEAGRRLVQQRCAPEVMLARYGAIYLAALAARRRTADAGRGAR